MRKLAEAIILQSIEDLWDSRERRESIEFFLGEGFYTCSMMAGISMDERLRILNLVAKILRLTAPQRMPDIEPIAPALTF